MGGKSKKSLTSIDLIKYIAMVLVINIVLAGVILYMVSHRPKTTDNVVQKVNGQYKVTPIRVSSTQPIISNNIVLNWSRVAATVSYTYDAANIERQIDRAVRAFFTSEGGVNFKNALVASGLLRNVTEKQMSLTSVVADQPVILKQGWLWSHYSYKVQFPLLLTYEIAGLAPINQRVLISMLILNLPSNETVSGIGIQQFWTRPSAG